MNVFCCGGSAASAIPPAPLYVRVEHAEWAPPDPLLAVYGSPEFIPPLHTIPTQHLPAPRSRDPFTGVLTPRQSRCLLRALPPSLHGQRWLRAYSLVGHGASLSTLLHRTRGLSPTVLALRTAAGVTLGAFCPSPWWDAPPAKLGQHSDMPPHAEGSAFFGFGGGAFVFSFAGGSGGAYPDTPGFKTSAWRPGQPHQLQYLLIEPKKNGGGVATRIGVGGGGESFALLLDEALERGVSGRCAAFESGSLLGGGGDGAFAALDVEVWAFGEADPVLEARSPSLLTEADPPEPPPCKSCPPAPKNGGAL